MHKSPYEEDEKKMRQYERNFRLEKKRHSEKAVFGHFEKYKKIDDDQYHHHHYRRTNELPESEMKSSKNEVHRHKKHRNHYHSHHHKIKRLRTKPEASIMQKKLKI
jgi:hypothetical protein